MINKNILSRIIKDNLELRLNQKLLSKGYAVESIRKLFRFITNIYVQMPSELINWRFKVVSVIGQYDTNGKDVLHIDQFKSAFCGECAIIMLSESTFVLESLDTTFIGQAHISYFFNSPLNEQLYIDDEFIPLTEYYDSAISSIFAYPVYKELDEAICNYDQTRARNSACGILKQAWKDDSRKEFCAKPEHFMRDSLYQYLDAVLRSHSVKREQNVDESHPVDVKVTWPIISNVALIEVKWLGDSGSTKHRDQRANDGAKQLIDYIHASYVEEPDKNFIGYLAVFDGRRGKRRLNQYQDTDIKYAQEYISHTKMKYYRFYLLECG